jgi:hypothetical protein
MKEAIFWNVTPCSTVEIHRRFGRMYSLHLWCWRVGQARSRQQAGFITSFLWSPNIFLHSSFLRNFSLCSNLRETNHIPRKRPVTTTFYSASLYLCENPRYVWKVWKMFVCFYLRPCYIRVSAVCFGICSNKINCEYCQLLLFFAQLTSFCLNTYKFTKH